MGANFIEIPVEAVRMCIHSTNVSVTLKPEAILPYTKDTYFADNEPYITTGTLTMLFRNRQESGTLVNLSDWQPFNSAMKKGDLYLTLITPPEFEDITLQAIEMAHNLYTELVEIKGKSTIKKEN